MKKILLICTLLVLLTGCTAPRDYKKNRFTKQFQEADSMTFHQEKVFYARNTLKYCEMKLNKKTERLIKRRAAELKKLYETPNPEVDKIISELRAEATKRPQNMSKEEEIAYILKKADENCDHIEIRKILNESNT